MHSLVMATVLVPGLTAGEGGETGPVGMPDVGQVRLDLVGRWVGTLGHGSLSTRISMRVTENKWHIRDVDPRGWGEQEVSYKVVGGKVRMEAGRIAVYGIFKVVGDQAFLCYRPRGKLPTSFTADQVAYLITLRRAETPNPGK